MVFSDCVMSCVCIIVFFLMKEWLQHVLLLSVQLEREMKVPIQIQSLKSELTDKESPDCMRHLFYKDEN